MCLAGIHIPQNLESDTLIDDVLRTELLHTAARLEDVPEDQKDWHLWADGQVLDLVA